jgi:hypothetical protein
MIDPRFHLRAAALDHGHLQLAVVELQHVALLERIDELEMRHADQAGGALFGRAFDGDDIVEAEFDLAAFKGADADFRPLQVGEHADGSACLLLSGADGGEAARMIVAPAMAEVEPEAVDAGLDEHGEPLRRIARGAHSGDDLAVTGTHWRGTCSSAGAYAGFGQ